MISVISQHYFLSLLITRYNHDFSDVKQQIGCPDMLNPHGLCHFTEVQTLIHRFYWYFGIRYHTAYDLNFPPQLDCKQWGRCTASARAHTLLLLSH